MKMTEYSVYDKETNEYTDFHWTQDDKWICAFVKSIAQDEPDRTQFYEFEDKDGNKYDCWDINNKFNLGAF